MTELATMFRIVSSEYFCINSGFFSSTDIIVFRLLILALIGVSTCAFIVCCIPCRYFFVIQFFQRLFYVLMIISKGTNSKAEFRIWISKLEFSDFIFGLTIRVDLIEMTQIQTMTHKHQISKMLAIAAINLITDPYSRWIYGTYY